MVSPLENPVWESLDFGAPNSAGNHRNRLETILGQLPSGLEPIRGVVGAPGGSQSPILYFPIDFLANPRKSGTWRPYRVPL